MPLVGVNCQFTRVLDKRGVTNRSQFVQGFGPLLIRLSIEVCPFLFLLSNERTAAQLTHTIHVCNFMQPSRFHCVCVRNWTADLAFTPEGLDEGDSAGQRHLTQSSHAFG